MKIFVAGHGGLVGSSLIRTKPVEHEIVVRGRNEIDITNKSEMQIFFHQEKIEAVIVAAAKVGGLVQILKIIWIFSTKIYKYKTQY